MDLDIHASVWAYGWRTDVLKRDDCGRWHPPMRACAADPVFGPHESFFAVCGLA